ncbi:hypothetical protein AQUSIP_04030 [Aquicella siphonis]|uniref:Uncharacterized protein n=1 Tax=Aquicella siphonis TaxID=254247 RepID=A0A5E4PFD1_9COXI|nr:hypothetical protein [Aquicella siphonis]VVC75127.1 hypothetical protein AQUSIP_04030 [Aquicella siphonis]
MSKTHISLTKTCASCGEQKPLSEFLQLAGAQGTTYGNICASCRKTQMEKDAGHKDTDEVTTRTTGVKIDSKAKVKGDIDKLEFRKQMETEYFDEREKTEEKEIKQTQKTQHTAREEKKHREGFLEKRSFLDSSKKPAGTSAAPVFGGEEQKAQAGKLDFATGPVEHTRVTGQIKLTQSPIYQAFKNWLGNAPIVSAAERAAKQKTNPGEKAHSDPLIEHMNNKYNPRNRK